MKLTLVHCLRFLATELSAGGVVLEVDVPDGSGWVGHEVAHGLLYRESIFSPKNVNASASAAFQKLKELAMSVGNWMKINHLNLILEVTVVLEV